MSSRQREELDSTVRAHRSQQRLVSRARIILRCADGLSGNAIAEELSIRPNTVSKWINRWIDFERRQEGEATDSGGDSDNDNDNDGGNPFDFQWASVLCDDPRPGAPPTFAVEAYVAIVALACQNPSKYDREIMG